MPNYRSARATKRHKRRFLLVLLAAIALMAAACGSDETEAAAGADSIGDTETVATSPVEDESEPEPVESAPEASPEDLIGTWSDSGGVTWQIEADAIIVTGGLVDEQSYSATSTSLEMNDVSGERACPPSQFGNYEWAIVDDILTLTLISDDCAGRGAYLDGRTLARQ